MPLQILSLFNHLSEMALFYSINSTSFQTRWLVSWPPTQFIVGILCSAACQVTSVRDVILKTWSWSYGRSRMYFLEVLAKVAVHDCTEMLNYTACLFWTFIAHCSFWVTYDRLYVSCHVAHLRIKCFHLAFITLALMCLFSWSVVLITYLKLVAQISIFMS